ncbi:NUMOD4 domain-containing protein [Paramuribaculum intestinale]|jgi:NUMOD4 motif./HNH endonuclease.|uniref:NUMOD4 domain-containing protein n=1 Tax=Paramuribaculum intestinale TaxID=2094151 RepID=UPI00272ABAD0|nr:NUMOD4 domain-containing protein [Paramuribaculum intestinale]
MNSTNTKEEWRDIPGYDGLYQVSSLGRVKHLAVKATPGSGRYAKTETIRKQNFMKNGYLVVDLYKDNIRKTWLVHRLVALTFIPNPDDLPYVNHIDSNRANCALSNLEWCTASQNIQHSYDANNRREKMNWKSGIENKRAKAILMLDKVSRKVLRRFDCIRDAERELGILNNCIVRCLKGKSKTSGGYIWVYAK